MNHVPASPTAEAAAPVTALARARASPLAAPGHFDELRGHTSDADTAPAIATHSIADHAGITDVWSQFFAHCETDGLGDLPQRNARLQQQFHDNSAASNVYADSDGPQRPWSPQLLPLILSPASWQQIETGVAQRMRLLDRILADVYGPQQLLARRLLPPALVQGHPGYARALHGVAPVGGSHLHLAAFDLVRGPDGHWRVASQHTQAPAGLGYLLKNRLAVSHLFPQAFDHLQVQHLGSTYRALVHSLQRMSPAGPDAHIALLTSGPYSAMYSEHAYLAQHLGMPLVEGRDLVVRDLRLYLQTLRGLVPVHGLLKCLDDAYLDPLELRADSTLGVPGLLQAMRAGHVLVANAPGSAFLESPALLNLLPALSQHLLGEELRLPALPRLTHGDDQTVQADIALAQMPTWTTPDSSPDTANIVPHPFILRVFAVPDGTQSWRVLPGGLAQVVDDDAGLASLQGSSSADVWALPTGPLAPADRLQAPRTPPAPLAHPPWVTRRAAENLFWLGRYTERADNQARLAQLTLACLAEDAPPAPPLLVWLERMARYASLVPPGSPAPTAALETRHAFAQALLVNLDHNTSVGYNLRALRLAGAAVRERLPQAHWHLIQRTEETFSTERAAHAAAPLAARDTLQHIQDHLGALASLQTERMGEDDGWLLLAIGRHLERLGFLATALQHGLVSGAVHPATGCAAIDALFDPARTVPLQAADHRDAAAVLHQLVQDRKHPYSLSSVAHALRDLLARLAASAPPPSSRPVSPVPDPGTWPQDYAHQAATDPAFADLTDRLAACSQTVYQVAHELGDTYFTHAGEAGLSLGT